MIFDVPMAFIRSVVGVFNDVQSPFFYLIGFVIIVGIIGLITDLYHK